MTVAHPTHAASTPSAPSRPQSPTSSREIDAVLAQLRAKKQVWAELPVSAKAALVAELVQNVGRSAERWVAAAAAAKGIPADSALVGEEWAAGPWALMYCASHYVRSLHEIERDGKPALKRASIHARRDGQVVVDVFPQSFSDSLLFNGIRAEVWMEPGVTSDNLRDHMAGWYAQATPVGKVAVVLGAGNVAGIAPLDVLHKLLAEGQVCVLKMNPVNDYLGPFMSEAFAPFITAGFVAIVYGGADVGAYLTQHPDVEEIHVTGSAATHDAIVWGPGAAGAARKARNEPINARRMTSELGNVSPVIVVPGPWSSADLRYQAEHIATMKMHNGGFNCVAAQVLVLPRAWPLSVTLTKQLERVLTEIPNRVAYYPGAATRQQATMRAHPEAVQLDVEAPDRTPRTLVRDVPSTQVADMCFQTEAFSSVLSQTHLPGGDAATFLKNAVTFCNDTLWGTLGANILIHPKTMAELGAAFEDAVADLRYGCVAVNAWTGLGFILCQTTWGAYPGHTAQDIRSGRGVVHNTLFFDRPQKSVVYQPFYPAPRALRHGSFTLLPKPPWFVTNKTAATTMRRLVGFERDHSVLRIPGIFASALFG
jgi:aldehyde dehydrogenase (NAD(P)+)